MNSSPHVVSFDRLRMTDVDKVGGKNASLGELISELGGEGVRVPSGFATTAQAFRGFRKPIGWTGASPAAWKPSMWTMSWSSRRRAPKFEDG